jgi:predicted anti-sigma-YlaC factor YlaD
MIISGPVVHVHEDDLELYIRGNLEPERIPLTESHLSECESCRQLLSDCLGQRIAFHAAKTPLSEATQRRSEPRFSSESEATLQELHPLSLERHKVKIVNVSKNGLGVVSQKPIFPGTIVQLRNKDKIELGNVRYSVALGDGGFQIGLRLRGEG